VSVHHPWWKLNAAFPLGLAVTPMVK
jgi:hypothetical protein